MIEPPSAEHFQPEPEPLNLVPDMPDTPASEDPDYLDVQLDVNLSANTISSNDLFITGKDDMLFEGELMKFKPGLSANFISRYVQLSKRAFRYFRN